MQKTGTASLPLHTGNAPPWLFKRMVRLGRAVTGAIIEEHGQNEFISRISNPYFFQSLGCVLGFDWHSSGVTTTVCGALKEALNNENMGVFIAGGKGGASRKAPDEICRAGEMFNISTQKTERLVYSSRMSAKVDNSLLQDSYQLYHHCFFLGENGEWSVVQQGMSHSDSYARRYHWLSERVKDFIEEPHSAICSGRKEGDVLDMTSRDSREARKASVDIVNEGSFRRHFSGIRQKTLRDFEGGVETLSMGRNHYIKGMRETDIRTLEKARDMSPKSYEELASIKGVGPKTIRSLALISDIIYGSRASWSDPSKFSFAHGGKDGIPYPVNRKLMDYAAETISNAVRQARMGERERMKAVRRLANII